MGLRRFAQFPRLPGWAVLLTVLALVTRLGSLRDEVIDWDESTFILLASGVVHGTLPYEVAWDNKPPGLYLSLGLAMRLFGETLIVVRLYGAACIALAAMGVFLIARRTTRDLAAGLAAGVFVAACSGYFLQSTMTEQPAAVFLVFGVWALLAGGGAGGSVFLAGALVGLAVLSRSNLGVVAVGLWLFLASGLIAPSGLRRRASAVILAAGGALPLAALVLVFAQRGEVALLYDSVVRVSLGFAGSHLAPPLAFLLLIRTWLTQMWDEPLTMPALSLLAVMGLRATAGGTVWTAPDSDRAVILLVILGVVASIAAGGLAYGHYLLQLMPLLAILAAPAFDAASMPRLRRAALALAVLSIGGATLLGDVRGALVLRDLPTIEAHYPARQVAAAIAADRAPGDQVFALSAHLVYWYLHQPPPSRLATHPSALLNTSMSTEMARLGLDRPEPFDAILAGRPRYIVIEQDTPWYLQGTRQASDLGRVLGADYGLWRTIAGIRVYRLRDAKSGTGTLAP